MGDLFDIANLITTVGVDAVKIKPEPGLPEKSSNEILTELFSTFDGVDVNSSSSSDSGHEDNQENKITSSKKINVKQEKKDEKDETGTKKKKSKKKHKHKHEGKDKEKKHKKKSKHHSNESGSEAESSESKKKKKKKKSKRKHESGEEEAHDKHSSKIRKTESSKKNDDVSTFDDNASHGNHMQDKHDKDSSEVSKIKKEKDLSPSKKYTEEKQTEALNPPLPPPVSKILNDDVEAPEVPKLPEKSCSKSSLPCKITIKDLKNSEVFSNTIKEVQDKKKEKEEKKKEKEEKLEDGEITDSDNDVRDPNRTPTLSPSPPDGRSLRSDPKYKSSPTRKVNKKNDLRNVLTEKKKRLSINNGSSSKDCERSQRSHSRSKRGQSPSNERSRSGRGRSRDRGGQRNNRSAYSRDRDRRYSRSEDRNRRRGRSRSRERKEHIEIDKKKLLEIARKNAISMIKKGRLPSAQQDKAIAAIQAGGKTIEELTDFCKNLSKSEAMGELSSISSDDESGSEKNFHHPFLLKDRPNAIIMNIRDSKQLPTKTMLEKSTESTNQLRLQYPVSSGQQHRKNEKEWVPVSPKRKNPRQKQKPEPKKMFIPAKEKLFNEPLPLVVPSLAEQMAAQQAAAAAAAAAAQAYDPMMQLYDPMVQAAAAYDPSVSQAGDGVTPQYNNVPPAVDPIIQPTINAAAGAEALAQAQCAQAQYPVPTEQQTTEETVTQQDSVFPAPPAENIDISAIVSQRLSAMRKLSENPHDVEALQEMYKSQNGMKTWVESKQIPGQFTGSTGAKVLTPAELNSGYQAWARKDQLQNAQPVSGGMGMHLLQKMGWRPGEGLGKNKEGTLEPLKLEVKLDKRGLVTDQDIGQALMKSGRSKKDSIPIVKTLEGKHPVSLLGEFCSKRKYGAPQYEMCFESGPDHKKNFVFKVRVNGVEYKPAVASPNKKLAKAEAAHICLQSIGLLP